MAVCACARVCAHVCVGLSLSLSLSFCVCAHARVHAVMVLMKLGPGVGDREMRGGLDKGSGTGGKGSDTKSCRSYCSLARQTLATAWLPGGRRCSVGQPSLHSFQRRISGRLERTQR